MTLAEMLARQQEIADTIRRENRNMTDDERSEFDDLTRSIQAQSPNNNQNDGSSPDVPEGEETPT